MGSKMVLDREKSSRSVQAATVTHRGVVVKEVGLAFGSKDAGEAAGVLLDVSKSRLIEYTWAMSQADEAHLTELSDDPPARQLRDESAAALSEELVAQREGFTAILGRSFVQALGFEGNTPVDPQGLLRLGQQVMASLLVVPAPTPRLPGFTWDPVAYTTRLQALLSPLSAALKAVATEEREAEAATIRKTRAIEAYDEVFSQTASLVSTLLRIAGETDLADRVRPSSRRRGQTVADEQDEAPATETSTPKAP